MVTRKIASHLLAGERPPSDPTPVYLSRTKARHTSRVFHGELEIEDYCRRRGFRIVYPERMSLRRQVRLFNAHNVFLGIQGSAFHTTLFRVGDETAHHVYLGDESGPTYALIDSLLGTSSDFVRCVLRTPGKAKHRQLDVKEAIAGIDRHL